VPHALLPRRGGLHRQAVAYFLDRMPAGLGEMVARYEPDKSSSPIANCRRRAMGYFICVCGSGRSAGAVRAPAVGGGVPRVVRGILARA
jgi:hypothetical protein